MTVTADPKTRPGQSQDSIPSMGSYWHPSPQPPRTSSNPGVS